MILMKLDNPGVPVTFADFLEDNRHRILPADASMIDFEYCGYTVVQPDIPSYDPDTHSVEPDTLVQRGDKWYQAFKVVARPPAPPAPPLTEHDYVAAMEHHYDLVARQRNYDNRITCALRAGYPGPFQAEGQAFAVWMDECNAFAYRLLRQIQAGTAAIPTIEGLLAMLPAFSWEEVPVVERNE